MNHTEQLKKMFEDRCAEFLEFHNKDKEDKATHIDHQAVRTGLFRECLRKFMDDNPDLDKFMIDEEWISSIIPLSEITKGNAEIPFVKQMDSIYEERYSFLKDLTDKEEQEFRLDEKKLRDTEIELIRKYNNIVSERLTHETCINYILDMVTLASKEKIEKYYTLTDCKFTKDYKEIERFNKDFQEILVKTLKQCSNDELSVVIHILRLIDLPEKKA